MLQSKKVQPISTFHKPIDFLNSDLFIKKKYTGKIVTIDETKFLVDLSDKEKFNFLDDIIDVFRQEVSKIRDTYFERPIYQTFEVSRFYRIVNSHIIRTSVERLIVDNKTPVSLAFKIALTKSYKSSLTALEEDLSQDQIDIIKRFVNYLIKRMRYKVTHIIINEIVKNVNEDFICLTNDLNAAYFYEIHPLMKAIIYNDVDNVVMLNHFATYYQIPIIKNQANFKDGDYVSIDINKNMMSFLSVEEQVFEIEIPIEKNISYTINTVESHKRHNFHIYPMIINYKDIDKVVDVDYFQKGIHFIPDFLIAANGTYLTVDEWNYRLNYMFSKCKGSEIHINLPKFGRHIKLFEDVKLTNTVYDLYEFPEYYENLITALATTHKRYPDKTVYINISNFNEPLDVKNLKKEITIIYRETHDDDNLRFNIEYNNHAAMYKQHKLMKSGGYVLNLDTLISDYIKESLLPRDTITLEHIRYYDLYADLQYSRKIQRDYDRDTSLILYMSGFHLTNEEIMNRMIIAGYRYFVVPVYMPYFIVPMIEKFQKTRYTHIGKYAIDIERTMFYRQFKKNAHPNAKWHGTYQKTKDSYMKKVEQLKQRKAEKERIPTLFDDEHN